MGTEAQGAEPVRGLGWETTHAACVLVVLEAPEQENMGTCP